MTKPENQPQAAPVTDAQFRNEFREMMYEDLRRSSDTTQRPASRYDSLASAYDHSQMYRQSYGANGLPDALRDPGTVQAQMRGYGNMAIHTFIYEINSNTVPVGTNGWLAREAQFKEIQRTIQDMAARGLQTEEQSYAAFGGKEAFERRREEATRNRDQPGAPATKSLQVAEPGTNLQNSALVIAAASPASETPAQQRIAPVAPPMI